MAFKDKPNIDKFREPHPWRYYLFYSLL